MLQYAKILYTVIILIFVFSGLAQPINLSIIATDTSLSRYAQPQTFNTAALIQKQLQAELKYWQKKNFLEASFDSIKTDSLEITAYLNLGKQYLLSASSSKSGTKNKTSEFNATQYAQVIQSIEATLERLEQNGYPFARVSVTPSFEQEQKIALKLVIDSGAFIVFDSILITGNSLQDKLFLMRYLNLKPNHAYNELDVKEIDQRLRQLPFLKVVRPAAVYFYQDKAQVIVCIDDKPSNNFEGIAGIRTDELNTNKYKITGDVNLQLNNVLATAASLKLQWRRFAAQNSDITIAALYPYFLGAPLALSNDFSLFRQDSNFQRLKNVFGFGYLFGGLNTLQFYYSYEKSSASLTSQQLDEAVTSNKLPSVNDYLNKNYGIKAIYINLDNSFNPSRGSNLTLEVSAGTHQVIQNSSLRDARASNGKLYSGYDSLGRLQNSIQLNTRGDVYFTLVKRNILNVFFQGAFMYHPKMFYNEQFQLGGLKTFRGVNELAIKATSYALLRTEYRYILPQTGYFNLFCNGIWYESNIVNSYKSKALVGFGGGIGLQTKGGIITVVYALANENGFVFKFGKVHIGFISVF